jgi:hypothetical protein
MGSQIPQEKPKARVVDLRHQPMDGYRNLKQQVMKKNSEVQILGKKLAST